MPNTAALRRHDLGPGFSPPVDSVSPFGIWGEIQHAVCEVGHWPSIWWVIDNCVTLLVIMISWWSLDFGLFSLDCDLRWVSGPLRASFFPIWRMGLCTPTRGQLLLSSTLAPVS